MRLKFPNARLYVQALIAKSGLTGAEAIAKAACEFGLVSQSSLPTLLETTDKNHCLCFNAAKNVLRRCHDEKSKMNRPSAELADIWRHVEKDAQTHATGMHCLVEPGSGFSDEMTRHNCISFAPVLFDLLLQQISRYY